MIYVLLVALPITLALAFVTLRAVKPGHEAAKKHIKQFAGAAAFLFLLFGWVYEARAEDPVFYLGALAGIDWNHDSTEYSPQCEPGDNDDLTSHGQLYFGVRGLGPVYVQLVPWRHKSCASGEDSNVYDAFAFELGVELEFDIF